jgi:hypothetical protein
MMSANQAPDATGLASNRSSISTAFVASDAGPRDIRDPVAITEVVSERSI